MDLSIIIVNWNSAEYLRKCIASILATTRDLEFEILVIDSASFDGCGEMLNERFPQVRFIQSDKNLGFARANNTAFKAARGRDLLFLNPDTEIEGAAVGMLYQQLNLLPNAAVVGAKLLNTDGSLQTSCIQAFPSILNQVFDADALRGWHPRSRLWGMKPLFSADSKPTDVDAVSGACLMISRSAFESVGMFSDDYFMYSEDVDLCFKVRRAGWAVYYVPRAVVLHHCGACSSQNRVDVFSGIMMLESRWRFFKKTRPLWYCWLYRMAMFTACVIRISLVLFVWPLPYLGRRTFGVKIVLKKWCARLRWTLGGEKWVRDFQG